MSSILFISFNIIYLVLALGGFGVVLYYVISENNNVHSSTKKKINHLSNHDNVENKHISSFKEEELKIKQAHTIIGNERVLRNDKVLERVLSVYNKELEVEQEAEKIKVNEEKQTKKEVINNIVKDIDNVKSKNDI